MEVKGGFKHSVKVPQLYKCAARITQRVAEGAGSLKQLVYEKKHINTKALYALVATTLQRSNELNLLLKRTHLLEKESRFDPWLARVLISELVWGKKQLPKSDAKPIVTVLGYEQAFRAHLSDTAVDISPADNYQSVSRKPRYVRVNTLKTSVNEAVELFEEEGWVLSAAANNYANFLEQLFNLDGSNFLKDFHVPELLIFPAGTEFYNHPGYKKGAIILQDKASCLPVHILSPPPGAVVLDMCAAPGMKTTQLAATIQDSGQVFAVERDKQRFEILEKMVESSGASCVTCLCDDVLQLNTQKYADVEYILVDPSCSGSGMTNRVEQNTTRDSFRLQKLAGFQIKILRAALTRFPNARRVVYSTCSLYPEENEDVVRQVLETNDNYKLVPAGDFLTNEWTNFGSSEFGKIGSYCLYARPETDFTNGFFLSVFERLEEGDHNEFYNGRVKNFRKDMDKKEARREKISKSGKADQVGFASQENSSTNDHKIKSQPEVQIHSNEINDLCEKPKKNKEKREQINNSDEAVLESEEFSVGKKHKKSKKEKHQERDELPQLVQEEQLALPEGNQIDGMKKKKKKKRDREAQLEEQAVEEPLTKKEKKSKKQPKD